MAGGKKRLPLHFLHSSVRWNLPSFHLTEAASMKYARVVFEMCQEPTRPLLRCRGRLMAGAFYGVQIIRRDVRSYQRFIFVLFTYLSMTILIYNQCDLHGAEAAWQKRSRQGVRGAVQWPLSTSTLIVWRQECTWTVKRFNQCRWSFQPCIYSCLHFTMNMLILKCWFIFLKDHFLSHRFMLGLWLDPMTWKHQSKI